MADSFWMVNYKGRMYLGGMAIVCAETAEEAIELVRVHPETKGFEDVKVKEIPFPGACVLFNQDGDY